MENTTFLVPNRQNAELHTFENEIATFLGIEIIEYEPASWLDGVYDFFKCMEEHGASLVGKNIVFCPSNAFIISYVDLLHEIMVQKSNLWKVTGELHGILILRLDAECMQKIRAASAVFAEKSNSIFLDELQDFACSHALAKKKLEEFVRFLSRDLRLINMSNNVIGEQLGKIYSRRNNEKSVSVVHVSSLDAASGPELQNSFSCLQYELMQQRFTYKLNERKVCFVAISEGEDSAIIDDVFFKNYSSYCEKHAYSLFLFKDRIFKNCTANWSKAALVRMILSSFEHVVFIDVDTSVVRPEVDIIEHFSHELKVTPVLFFDDPGRWEFNSGSIILQRGSVSSQFLSRWFESCRAISLKEKSAGVYTQGGDQYYAIVSAKNTVPGFPEHVIPSNKGWNVHPAYVDDSTIMIHFMGLGPNLMRSKIMNKFLKNRDDKQHIA